MFSVNGEFIFRNKYPLVHCVNKKNPKPKPQGKFDRFIRAYDGLPSFIRCLVFFSGQKVYIL